jgi:hypothetical protein
MAGDGGAAMTGLTRELEKLKARMKIVAIAAAQEAAEEALRLSLARVPVITGNLKSGGNAQPVSWSTRGALSSTFYIAPYAADVHENANGRGYKWLELAANDVDMQAILKKKWEESQ